MMGSGNDGDEVPVVPPPRKLAKIHPDYFTVTLPWVYKLQTSTEAQFAYSNSQPFVRIRLNSVYDPLKEISAIANPLRDIDRQPQGLTIWESHFKYYRVLRCRVKLTFVNNRFKTELENDKGDPFNEH